MPDAVSIRVNRNNAVTWGLLHTACYRQLRHHCFHARIPRWRAPRRSLAGRLAFAACLINASETEFSRIVTRPVGGSSVTDPAEGVEVGVICTSSAITECAVVRMIAAGLPLAPPWARRALESRRTIFADIGAGRIGVPGRASRRMVCPDAANGGAIADLATGLVALSVSEHFSTSVVRTRVDSPSLSVGYFQRLDVHFGYFSLCTPREFSQSSSNCGGL